MLFGECPANPKVVAGRIIRAIRQPGLEDSSPEWTRALKEALCRQGEEQGFRVYSSLKRPGKQAREWLLDVVWYNPANGTISLAVESEWDVENDVLDDFEKLLCVKAPLKTMAYFAYKGSAIPSFEAYLGVFDHHVKGEQYLVIEFHGTKEVAYLYEIPNDGKVSSPKFSALALERTAGA